MSKIFFNGIIVWNKKALPSEFQARRLFAKYAPSVGVEAEIALSAGIDVKAQEGWFSVELSTDKKKGTKNEKN